MSRRLISLMAALMFASSASAAAAAAANTDCAIEMDSSAPQWRIDDLDVFSQQTRVATFQLNLINSGSGQCLVHLGFDTAGSPFGLLGPSAKRVPYQIIDHDSGKDLTPNKGNLSSNYPGVIKVGAQSTVTLNIDFVVFPELDADGQYTQSLIISADGNGNNDVHTARTQTLVATAASSATMSLNGSFTRTGAVADIDLGVLDGQGPVALPLFLKVRSTRAYRIRSTSQNNGKLLLSGTAWSIPYRMTINGIEISPAGGEYLSTSGLYRRLDTIPLGFNIMGSTDVQAGRYSDLVTLEISLN